MFKYKGNTDDENFCDSDIALVLIHKIKNGEISLNEPKDEQAKFKSSMGEIKRVPKNICQEIIEKHEEILKTFTGQNQLLLIFLMNLLQEYLKLDVMQKQQHLKLGIKQNSVRI